MKHYDLFSSFFNDTFFTEIKKVIDICCIYNLNVYIHIGNKELLSYINEELKKENTNKYILLENLNNYTSSISINNKQKYIILSEKKMPTGLGAVQIKFSQMIDYLIPATKIVLKTLQYFKKEQYIDLFNREKMNLIKEYLYSNSLTEIIAYILNTIFYAGVLGKEEANPQIALKKRKEEKDISMNSAELFCQKVLTLNQQPFELAKVIISYYSVHIKKNSNTLSSKILNISRTTLSSHLRLANELNANKIFS